MKKWWTRIGLAWRQNRLALAFVVLWLAANAVAFVRLSGMTRGDAIALALCVAKAEGAWPRAYQSFTEIVVFGLVASMIVTNVTRRYRPEETCRALASSSSGHVVVVGFTNLGRRVYDLVRDAKRPVVVVESDRNAVASLVAAEEPLVVGDAQELAVLEAAGVARAKVVVIATDDLETAAVAARHVRDLNDACELVLRCPDDDVGAVLARTYRARAVSTSKVAAAWVQAYAIRERRKAVLVLGINNIGKRVSAALEEKRIPHRLEALSDEPTATAAASDLVVICDDDLGKNLVRVDRLRDVLRPGTKIICRAFHEDAAAVLRRAPLDCIVFSSSRQAVTALAKAGVFREVGIEHDLAAEAAARVSPSRG